MTDEKKSPEKIPGNPGEKSKNSRQQTSGAWTWFRRHEMPPGNEDVEAELKEFYERIIAMYCSDGKLNPHQEKLLQRAVHKLGFCILCEKGAWERGPIQQNAEGNPVTRQGKDFHVWKKQPDGSWKVVIDIWNFDQPASTTSK